MDEPFFRAFAVDCSTLRLVVLAAAKFDLWAPLSTAFPIPSTNRNALKGTPTAQPFDNRSIA